MRRMKTKRKIQQMAASIILMAVAGGAPWLVSAPAIADNRSCSLKINVAGVRNSKGRIHLALFNRPDDKFPEGGVPARQLDMAAVQEVTSFRVTVPCGHYAVAVFHDENGNKIQDRNMLGIPTEGYGFSNNPDSRFGPPPYTKAEFELNDGVREIEIRITYLMD